MISDMHNRTILVTGGAGFIGSEVVNQLVQQGAQVIAIDNLINGKRENLLGLPSERFRLEVADIRDAGRMRALLAGTELVLHLACLGVRHSIHSPLENHEVNATATLGLLEAARDAGVRRFVYVSSSEIYGTAQAVPMTEQHPAWPMTVYGAAKLAGERYTDAYWRAYQLPTVVIRPFNAFGPRSHHEGDCGEVIPKFMLRAMAGRPLVIHGDGTQTRDFTYVADTARGILLAATAERAIGETINLGQGKEISVIDLAAAIGAATGRNDIEIRRGPPRPGDVLRLYADGSKAAELLGFRPEISLSEGLGRLRDWYESSGLAPETLLSDEVEVTWQAQSRKPG
jgi:UDP-glucose 4-epimerase